MRRLAGAIGAEDGNRFSGAQANADFVERLVTAVGVAQPEDFKHGACHALQVQALASSSIIVTEIGPDHLGIAQHPTRRPLGNLDARIHDYDART